MSATVRRLQRALREARRLSDASTKVLDATGGEECPELSDELLRYVRRVGYLLSLLSREMQATGGIVSGCDEPRDDDATEVINSANTFLSEFLGTHMPHFNISASCVGVMVRQCTPKYPFDVEDPFFIHEDHHATAVQLKRPLCQKSTEVIPPRAKITSLKGAATPMNSSSSSHVIPLQNSHDMHEAAQKQMIDEIKNAIREIKEGALSVSDIVNREKEHLEANAALLQRGVSRTTAQCRNMDRIGPASGGGLPLPRLLGRVPGAELFWSSFLLPLWSFIKQTLFILTIVGVTGGMMLMMLVTPKTYVYAR
uniref:Uncharacterized protein TCIL3000_10_13890 n=1 Tax=Trypanosoma congolense (strain IL3000) TaxID=1068625 RepID=G0UYY6_TRYCI|nr:unnamed protein product [Trypanosoma congolense IL3000]